MIESKYDPKKPYRYVEYLRMSDPKQNPRSPDQQNQMIQEELSRQKNPWRKVKDYRDDAVSGKYLRRRLAFFQMIKDIRDGSLKVDLILVDTAERFGRLRELPRILAELEKLGVLVLCADTHFIDPTSLAGRATSMVDNLRATEENRVKGHQVRRGKRDLIRLGFWPGGPLPFGFKLESFLYAEGKYQRKRSKLVPDPSKAWIVTLAFDLARTKGWGQDRITRFLNDHPEIPSHFKPFVSATVGCWLDNALYHGTYIWDKMATDIIDDRRVMQRKEADEILTVDNYCEAIVSVDDWKSVYAMRRGRGKGRRSTDPTEEKLLRPLAPGQTLKYPLTGMVICGQCGLVMTPSSSASYRLKSGEDRRYVHYICPGPKSSICTNTISFREAWLRQVVTAKLKERLIPADGENDSPFMAELTRAIQEELGNRREGLSPLEGLTRERESIEKRRRGWILSLANPDLDGASRREIEAALEQDAELAREVEQALARRSAILKQEKELVDEQVIRANLDRLHELLAIENPTRCNLELALHIDWIKCFPDRRVQMRLCKLGGVLSAIEFLRDPSQSTDDRDPHTDRRRRRGKLSICDDGTFADVGEVIDFATDPRRFEFVPGEWFWIDEFISPNFACWAELNARAVHEHWQANGCTMLALSQAFGKSIPTVRKALLIEKGREELTPNQTNA
jgi:DNA invertase Pin-like site-specific DNA recombinase